MVYVGQQVDNHYFQEGIWTAIESTLLFQSSSQEIKKCNNFFWAE